MKIIPLVASATDYRMEALENFQQPPGCVSYGPKLGGTFMRPPLRAPGY